MSDLHAVSLLSAGERFNVPCYLSVYKSDINRSGDDNYANWNPCITTSPNEIVGWANNAGVYVNGIAACTNSSHDRLKGIELFGVTILPDGGFLPFPIPVWFSRTNCQAWHPAVFCPAGQVATKVRIDHTGGDTIVGLSLGCRVVTEQ